MSDGCPDRIVSGTLPPHFKEVKGIMRSDEGLYASFWVMKLLKGIEYNSSIKGKGEYTNEVVSTNCESEKWDTEVEKDKKVSLQMWDEFRLKLRL